MVESSREVVSLVSPIPSPTCRLVTSVAHVPVLLVAAVDPTPLRLMITTAVPLRVVTARAETVTAMVIVSEAPAASTMTTALGIARPPVVPSTITPLLEAVTMIPTAGITRRRLTRYPRDGYPREYERGGRYW
ncbi:hypothetical protein ColLi_04129 [Colletotrichum liriopes]|uniref:Uncharacterized protein n=1 Tax=Colletotrichum liriopes TaxID=708192 RepID=A0AA37GJ35_9PEZI|nr:hypothetical protein ColLi_04129 [Colletotrichum liriopes]